MAEDARPKLTKDFFEYELVCQCGCGLLQFYPGLPAELQSLRNTFGHPMIITSGCRCKVHNARPASEGGAGGHPRSLHVGDFEQHPGQKGCLAVDVATPDSYYRGELFYLAWEREWSIGWNAKRKFLHLDKRVWIDLPQASFDY